MENEIYRGVFALALLGPSLIGIAVPVTSGVVLRRHLSGTPQRVSPAALAGALALWVALAVGAAVLLVRVAAFTAMGWADARTSVPTTEAVELLAIVSAGLLLLLGCGMLLHRFLIRTSTTQ